MITPAELNAAVENLTSRQKEVLFAMFIGGINQSMIRGSKAEQARAEKTAANIINLAQHERVTRTK